MTPSHGFARKQGEPEFTGSLFLTSGTAGRTGESRNGFFSTLRQASCFSKTRFAEKVAGTIRARRTRKNYPYSTKKLTNL